MPHEEFSTEGALRVLEAINSTLELRQVLSRLVDVTVEVTGAERSMILLFEGSKLVPAALAAVRPNVEFFRRFYRMPPIDLDEVPDRRAALEDPVPGPVVIEDIRTSSLVPPAWAESFGPRSVALMLLTTGEDPLGLLVVDHPFHHEFTAPELKLVQTIAHAARVAIGNAALQDRLARKTEVQREVFGGLAQLASAVELNDVLASIAGCVSTLFERRSCSISFVEGGEQVTSGTGEMGESTVIPLRMGGALLGYLTLRGGPPPTPEELEALEAFAHQAAFAIDRDRLAAELRERERRVEASSRLSDVLVGPGDLNVVLDRLNDDVCRDAGFTCQDVAFRRRQIAELLGCRPLAPAELALAASLVAETTPGVEQVDPDGLHAAPVTVGRQVVGVLFVRPANGLNGPLTDPQKELVRALAARIGDVVHKARLQAALRRAEARVELAAMRRRIADRVDVTVGQTLRALWEDLSAALARHRDAPGVVRDLAGMRSLVSFGLMEAHATAESIAVLGVRRDGLYQALGGLLRSFEDASGVSTTLRVTGAPFQLPVESEERLYAIAFDALWAVERSGRATTVVLTLAYGDDVTITLRDDGCNLAQRGLEEPGPGVHYGLGTIRDRVEALGGRVSIQSAEPRGVRLEVHLDSEALKARSTPPSASSHPEAILRRFRART